MRSGGGWWPRNPKRVGHVIIDKKLLNLFMPSVFPPQRADTLDELAYMMGLPADQLNATVDAFNAARGDTSNFHPTEFDGVATSGIEPANTRWVRPIINLWTAGEPMPRSILGQGYLAGFGMTTGTIFGRIAGQEATAFANRSATRSSPPGRDLHRLPLLRGLLLGLARVAPQKHPCRWRINPAGQSA
nr:hypothetical protein [Shimia biformata]